MIFNSAVFLIFFLIFFPTYWLVNRRLPLVYRNLFIIISSYIFYGWWDWRFLSLIIFSSTLDFSIGLFMARVKRPSNKKALLATSLILNLGVLGVFKYFNFFIDSLNGLLSILGIPVNTTTLSIILPVGISFYTFQTLSYTIDIYRQKITPTKDPFAFFAFVSFFPQLVAGPIERASHLLKQFQTPKQFSYDSNVIGLRLILWGLFKKLVIADNFGVLVDVIFDPNYPVNGLATIAGALFFAFQIYADFSGYSDIAIGISRMLGFNLKKNFSTPYFSSSFGEFWQRWHISLSTWFRDYLYIPLGGNRGRAFMVYRNLFITFIVSGLWHGASVNFIIWGALHGLVLALEKASKFKIPRQYYAPFVFITVVLFWIPFRAQDVTQLIQMTKSIFEIGGYSLSSIYQIANDFSIYRFIVLLLVLGYFLFIEYKMKTQDFSEWIMCKSRIMRYSQYYIIIILILLIGNFDVKPSFIYFQF